MCKEIILFFFLIFLYSCEKATVSKASEEWVKVSERFEYKEDTSGYKAKVGRFTYDLKKSEIPYKKIMFLNASLVAYVSELELEDRITGISSPEYIFSESIQKRIKDGHILNIGTEQKYNVEMILQNKPDAIFSNYIETFEPVYDVLRKNGIQMIFVDEYLEVKPLDKTAYLLFFGKLLGVDQKASEIYNRIKTNYAGITQQASQVKEKPTILASEMYGNYWYLPGGNSNMAHFFKDANANYILNDNETKSMPFSFEEVFIKSKNATIWVNAGNHVSKQDLLKSNALYQKMDIFNKGKIYAATAREIGMANDFYQSGQVRADLVLKDYVKIFHPELFKNDSLYYMKQIF